MSRKNHYCRYCNDGYRVDGFGDHTIVTSLRPPAIKVVKCANWQPEDTSATYESLGRTYEQL